MATNRYRKVSLLLHHSPAFERGSVRTVLAFPLLALELPIMLRATTLPAGHPDLFPISPEVGPAALLIWKLPIKVQYSHVVLSFGSAQE
jgi:hypothetical protein